MVLLTCLAGFICLVTIISAYHLLAGIKKMGNLGEVSADSGTHPLISIIIPACNEEQNIAESIRTFLALDYPNLEIIVINDRSVDNTPAILSALAKEESRISVHHITSLPKGWMGKSHALHLGASKAKGSYLLFSDADVLLEKSTLQRAINHMTNERLDHLTCLFKNNSPGWLLNSLIVDSSIGLLQLFRPWLLKNQQQSPRRAFAGIGAFNMVKASVYRTIGGHQSINFHPVDDMMLGKLIGENDFRQDCLLAYDFIQIPWYDSLKAMVNGLQKNTFAIVHYRALFIAPLIGTIMVTMILPFWGAIFGADLLQLFCITTVAGRCLTFFRGLQLTGLGIYHLPACLVTPYISCYILVKAACMTTINGGISWRGQFYKLADLKKSRPLIF